MYKKTTIAALLLVLFSIIMFVFFLKRIETGSVGIRIGFDKQIQGKELMPGSWNQTLIGDVLIFPVKDIPVSLENKNPLTADNSPLADFDVTIVYSINPAAVAELYTTKSKAFHAMEQDGDTLLMWKYIETIVNNASYKSVRNYKSLEVADFRAKIEGEIRDVVLATLKEEGLSEALSISLVQVRNAQPNADILKAATEYVKAQNDLRIKETEVAIAKKEAERMAALAVNSSQSILFMQAQAQMKIAEGIANGKVHTIVVPMDFKGMVNTPPVK